MAKQKTNVQIVKDIMEYSNHGALVQMFVIDALTKWSKMVADKPIEELREQFGENAFISADAWQGVAKEVQAKLNAAYGK